MKSQLMWHFQEQILTVFEFGAMMASPPIVQITGNTYRAAKEPQVRWALRRGLRLVGSRGDRGEPAYAQTLDENLFMPLNPESRREFEQGDGGELVEDDRPAKMQAVHSSAALTVNVFDYWRHQPTFQPLLNALGLPANGNASLAFEAKRPIVENVDRNIFKVDPNLDVVLNCRSDEGQVEVGVECKFTELYRAFKPEDHGLKWPYFRERSLWDELPACLELARTIRSRDTRFQHLHAAQLLKHILGLKHRNGMHGFRLLYLWFDVSDKTGQTHRVEIQEFEEAVSSDGIRFSAITFQEVIGRLAQYRPEHPCYVDYLVERYLPKDVGFSPGL